ncbi:GNAT family N-acetyltransferase [Pantoea sp. BS_8]|uniref:GNAT family N-acetyltransferase n=1 Tax=Pantoea TaxID=53335 RepID=UPI00249EAF5E|nr:GNAT family N-acetyltransferase [Pantoea stewartii]
MSYRLVHYKHFADVPPEAYERLWEENGSPAFYHPRFIASAEQFPLLPIAGACYLSAWQDDRLCAFLVAWQQMQPDPFGTLAQSTGIVFTPPEGGLLGHIAHCYDTRILLLPGAHAAAAALLEQLADIARAAHLPGCGLLNLPDETSLKEVVRAAGYKTAFMHHRFAINLRGFSDFDEYVNHLPRDGRHEMRRQLRKFAASSGTIQVLPGEEADLSSAVALAQRTSAKNGTPDYYPHSVFEKFLTACGDLISVVQVKYEGKLVSAIICLNEPGCLHLWAGGADYAHTAWSPYSIMVAAGVQHALHQGLSRVEVGRTNPRIKARLGCQPLSLYSALWQQEEA